MSRHTKKAQKVVGLCDFLFKPLARSIFDRLLPKGRKKDWRGVGEWSEAPSYEEGVGGDGEQQGFALQNVYSLLEKLEKERKADGAVVGALDVGVDESVGEVGTETIGDDEIIDTPTGVLLTRLKTV